MQEIPTTQQQVEHPVHEENTAVCKEEASGVAEQAPAEPVTTHEGDVVAQQSAPPPNLEAPKMINLASYGLRRST
eukprot:5305794-Ditylum_brightwellii.AAC.1